MQSGACVRVLQCVLSSALYRRKLEGESLAFPVRRSRSLLARGSCLLLATVTLTAAGQDTALVNAMVGNEVLARKQEARYSYLSSERSARTGGHLWQEKVVETDDGSLRRLLAVDGKPLQPEQAKAEDDRILDIVRNPAAFQRENTAHRDDEARATDLLQLLPRAFLLTAAGESDGCARFSFRPNPAFQPATYEERVIHAMGGTVSLRQPMNRLCALEATILTPVEFAHGLLGTVGAGGHFGLARIPVAPSYWKSNRISLHVQGRILMLKSLTREQETDRTDVKLLPGHPTLAQAARLSLP